MLAVAAGALAKSRFREDRLRAAASNPALFATDAADYLVHRGVPFRKAHDLVGKILREAEKHGKVWTELSLPDLQKIAPEIDEGFLKNPSVENSIAAKSVPGGTAESSVRAAIAQLEQKLASREKPS